MIIEGQIGDVYWFGMIEERKDGTWTAEVEYCRPEYGYNMKGELAVFDFAVLPDAPTAKASESRIRTAVQARAGRGRWARRDAGV